MSAIHQTRIERQKCLADLLPPMGAAPRDCRDAVWLLEKLGDLYGKADQQARLRKLQRDLQDLVADGRIEAVNPGGKPLLYRRKRPFVDDLSDDDPHWQDIVSQIQRLATDYSRHRHFDPLWLRLLTNADGLLLDGSRLRILPDTLRLQPPVINPQALTAVIAALAQGYALDVEYENAQQERAVACIHPQALIQRGPIPYLFALKNDEDEPVRLYALHRMVSATALPDTPARKAKGFDLDQAIAKGLADFGRGEMIALKIRVRSHLTELLQTCPLSADQDEQQEPDDSDFKLRISATVPSTGQLLRWLLGMGDKLEVIEPPALRQTVRIQAAKMAGLYGGSPETKTPSMEDEADQNSSAIGGSGTGRPNR
jgi:proteasome accessory factor B